MSYEAMFYPFFSQTLAELFGGHNKFTSVFVFDCFDVQFIHLYRFEGLVEVFELQTVEIGVTFARSFQ